MKTRIISLLFMGVLLFQGAGMLVVHAQSYVPLAPLPIESGGVIPDTYNLSDYLSGMIMLIISIGAMIAIFVTILGGVQYVASGIAPSAKQDAKNRIINAVTGLALILSSYLILNSINPELVDVSFDLPAVSVQVTEILTVPESDPTSAQNTNAEGEYIGPGSEFQ